MKTFFQPRPSVWTTLGLLLLTATAANAQLAPADDFFHGGARHYLSNNIPAALQSVTNGLQLYPEDEKLKKLYELLNQQQQQDQKDQQQDKQDEQKQDQKKDEKKQDEKKDQQSKDEQQKKDEEKKKQQQDKDKKEQGKKDQQQAKPDDKKESGEPKPVEAHAMTAQEAKQMLDAQKGDEQVLLFKPEVDPKRHDKKLKDW
jgi:Ca-activated chloride channel family protein